MLYSKTLCVLRLEAKQDPSFSKREQQWILSEHPALVQHRLSGFTEARRRLVIASEIAARVTKVLVDVGQSITAPAQKLQLGNPALTRKTSGTVVLELDSRAAESRLAMAAASMQMASAELKQSMAEIQRLQLLLSYSERKLRRLEPLLKKKRATVQEVDDASSALEDVIGQLAVAQAQNEHKQANLERMKAQESLREIEMDHCKLRAPLGWIVDQRHVEPGHFAVIGEPLLTLLDTSEFRVSFRLSSTELESLRKQARPMLKVFSTQRQLASRIEFVSTSYDALTRKRKVDLLLQANDLLNAGGECSGGIQLVLTMQIHNKAGGYMIPKSYVQVVLEQSFVKDSSGQIYAITVLSSLGDTLQILPGKTPVNVPLVPVESN